MKETTRGTGGPWVWEMLDLGCLIVDVQFGAKAPEAKAPETKHQVAGACAL